ncbi:unnamed protein product [Calypogeia fissa]
MEARVSFTKWLEFWGSYQISEVHKFNLSSTSNQQQKLPFAQWLSQWQGEQSGEEDNSNLLKLQSDDVVIEVQSDKDGD